ncbi:MAG: right-handed parallel beta-helix repeat-containing protein [Planctomycetes bacterium]|nr:right-handed parallel beta-helix repeat-containing protein [Planctomycetota bacterium]
MIRSFHLRLASIVLPLLCALVGSAENAAAPAGKPVLDPPTLRSLGGYWIVQGDDDRDATVTAAYRKHGSTEWKPALPFFRVARDAKPGKGQLEVPAGSWLFAGSVLLLDPDSEYEIKLTLVDPDGGKAEEVLKQRTIAEPVIATGAPRKHVVPGDGGGAGTKDDPFKGLAAAQAAAKPGDVMVLRAGNYGPLFAITTSGEPGKPIVWQGAGDGDVVIGTGTKEAPSERAIVIENQHDVWLQKLTVGHAGFGVLIGDSSRVVIQRCRFFDIRTRGITFCRNGTGTTSGFFISDNVLEGASAWPRSQGIEDMNAIHGTGYGHEICYNRISGFADAIDTFGSASSYSIDIHNNDVSELTDDGIELDYTQRNNRCYLNRITNAYQGISVQPVLGGPAYIVRNALYNVCVEPFKMHNSPSGSVVLHNTIVKKERANVVMTSAPILTSYFRNNLFIGTDSDRPAIDFDCPTTDCDFDYNGYGFGKTSGAMKWNNVRYATLDEVKQKAPIEKHATFVEAATAFASGIVPPADEKVQAKIGNDLRLKEGTAAIDAGQPLANVNDGFAGKAPDLGAYEFGAELPHYGPRPEKK